MDALLIASSQQGDLVALVAIVALAVGGTLLAGRLKLPSIVVLLALGLLAGPVTGLLEPDELLGNLLFPLVSLAVGVILFEGGLLLNLRELRADIGAVVRRLLTIGALITWIGGAVGASLLLGLDAKLAALLGAILVVSGPTVVLPLLEFIKPKDDVEATLKWEGVFIDPLGAILAVLVFEAVLAGEQSPTILGTLGPLGYSLLAGTIVGAVAATLLIAGLRSYQIDEQLQPTATLMMLFAAVAVANVWREESGLIAATLMGVVMVNQQRVPIQRITEFKQTLGPFLTSLLFIVLSARLTLTDLEAVLGVPELLFLVVLVVAVRPLAVAVATVRSSLSIRERIMLASIAPRGVVAAAVASLFGLQLAEEGVTNAELLAPLTFGVIIGTALIAGLAGLPIARRLGLTNENPQETLVVGGGDVALELARGIAQLGSPVTYAPGAEETHEGLEVYSGHLLGDIDEIDGLDLSRFGQVVVASPMDEYNSVISTRLVDELGRRCVFQLDVEQGDGPDQPDLRGRPLFESEITYEQLERRVDATGPGPLLECRTAECEELLLPGENGNDGAVLARWSDDDGLEMVAHDDHDANLAGASGGARLGNSLRSSAATVVEALSSVTDRRRRK